MLTFSEAQLLAWMSPLLWPFVRALALLSALPVLGTRNVPARVRIGLALLLAVAAGPSLPPMPQVPLDSLQAAERVLQQVLIGLTLGFAVRVAFAAIEFAGELIGLQMGLNFAAFYDPLSASTATTTSRFFGTLVAWLFLLAGGHLLVLGALVRSFGTFPIGMPLAEFLSVTRPATWGAEILRTGLLLSLPLVAMLWLVNGVLGLVSRVAPQINVFAVGFPLTLTVGLVGLVLTLPALHDPFMASLGRMLSLFQ